MRYIGLLIMGCVLTAFAGDDDRLEIDKFDALIKAENYAEASRLLEDYTRDHATSWRAFYQLGYAYFRLHRVLPSLNALSRSLALHSDFGEAHKILAFDLNILGRKDLAIEELQKAITLTPNPWESRYELGRIYFERGSYLQSVEQLEKAKALAPDFVKTYHNLGLAYGAINQPSQAIKNFEDGLLRNRAQNKPSSWPLIDYAAFRNLQGDFASARDLLLQAIQLNSSWQQAFEELSKAYRGLGEPKLAIESLKKAINLNPQKADNHYVLSRLYSQVDRVNEAKQELLAYEKTRSSNVAKAR